mmetsp:Transcript_35789/g.90258  ORF Transcript_35789/g.90258 Transcript_35789/m.90258 type:complete len:269 (+) Transcript_35789:557-1363(+)
MVRHGVHHLVQQLHRRVEVVLLAVLRAHVRNAHRREHHAREDVVRRRLAAYVYRNEPVRRPQAGLHHLHLPLVDQLQRGGVRGVLLADKVGEGYALAAAKGDCAVIGDLHAIKFQQDIALVDDLGHRRSGLHPADQDPLLLLPHAERLTQVRVLHLLPLQAERGESGVRAVGVKVVDKVVDDGRGDDVADVLRILVLERLKRDADALADVVEGGAAAVATVDGRVDLDAKQLRRAVHVGGHLDAGHHALRHRHGVAPNRKSNDRDGVL